MVSGQIAVDQAIEMRYTLRMLGCEVKGHTVLFGDNKSMINNTSLTHSMLKKRSNANCYHRVQEAVAAGYIRMVHCGTKFNLADMGTKALNGPDHQRLLWNQSFPPASAAGECQPAPADTMNVGSNLDGSSAKLTLRNMNQMEHELVRALGTRTFLANLRSSTREDLDTSERF